MPMIADPLRPGMFADPKLIAEREANAKKRASAASLASGRSPRPKSSATSTTISLFPLPPEFDMRPSAYLPPRAAQSEAWAIAEWLAIVDRRGSLTPQQRAIKERVLARKAEIRGFFW